MRIVSITQSNNTNNFLLLFSLQLDRHYQIEFYSTLHHCKELSSHVVPICRLSMCLMAKSSVRECLTEYKNNCLASSPIGELLSILGH